MVSKSVAEKTFTRGPIVIENSPVSFVISGPRGRHREGLVRSTHDNLDLVSYDHSPDYHRELVLSPFAILNSLFFTQVEVERSNSVRSAPIVGVSRGNEYDDERLSYLTFSWRGNASRNTVEIVEDLFQKSSVDIFEAIQEGDSARLEWHLSAIIHACIYATTSVENRRKAIARLTIFVVGGYFVIAAAVAAAYIVDILKPFA